MNVALGPTDAEIVEALGGALCGKTISSLRRRAYRYATSFPLDELELQLADGQSTSLILKDLTWERLPEVARRGKPAFLYDPGREIETYVAILGPSGLGPRCFATRDDASGSGSWLILEKVRGVELWQVGEVAGWEAAARWVARLHARFAASDALAANPHLLQYDVEWFLGWAARAKEGLVGSEDPRSGSVVGLLDQYEPIAERLAALPMTFVHGEYFASNILVDVEADPPKVSPVDWEMSAVGPSLLDVAALVTGWNHGERERLITAYRDEVMKHKVGSRSPEEFKSGLHLCQLHFALQWIGWSPHWTAPTEHARDWLGDAVAAAKELSLL